MVNTSSRWRHTPSKDIYSHGQKFGSDTNVVFRHQVAASFFVVAIHIVSRLLSRVIRCILINCKELHWHTNFTKTSTGESRNEYKSGEITLIGL